MGLTLDIGRRIELVPMDPHFHNISIALYRQQFDEGPQFLVHTYSRRDGAQRRAESVARTMQLLGGMESVSGESQKLRFACGFEHHQACRRVFLEACKVVPNGVAPPRPLNIFDKKSNRTIIVASLGGGVYHLTADGEEEGKASRVSAVAGGLIKLGQMSAVEQHPDRVAFPCRQAHDAMVGLLLVRALNVRAVLREEEMASSRGVLSAPSAQKQ